MLLQMQAREAQRTQMETHTYATELPHTHIPNTTSQTHQHTDTEDATHNKGIHGPIDEISNTDVGSIKATKSC